MSALPTTLDDSEIDTLTTNLLQNATLQNTTLQNTTLQNTTLYNETFLIAKPQFNFKENEDKKQTDPRQNYDLRISLNEESFDMLIIINCYLHEQKDNRSASLFSIPIYNKTKINSIIEFNTKYLPNTTYWNAWKEFNKIHNKNTIYINETFTSNEYAEYQYAIIIDILLHYIYLYKLNTSETKESTNILNEITNILNTTIFYLTKEYKGLTQTYLLQPIKIQPYNFEEYYELAQLTNDVDLLKLVNNYFKIYDINVIDKYRKSKIIESEFLRDMINGFICSGGNLPFINENNHVYYYRDDENIPLIEHANGVLLYHIIKNDLINQTMQTTPPTTTTPQTTQTTQTIQTTQTTTPQTTQTTQITQPVLSIRQTNNIDLQNTYDFNPLFRMITVTTTFNNSSKILQMPIILKDLHDSSSTLFIQLNKFNEYKNKNKYFRRKIHDVNFTIELDQYYFNKVLAFYLKYDIKLDYNISFILSLNWNTETNENTIEEINKEKYKLILENLNKILQKDPLFIIESIKYFLKN
jgi:hypothetical protein